MIGALGRFLSSFGMTWLGKLILAWDANRRASVITKDEQAGANKQMIQDVTVAAKAQGRIAQAEAETDRTQAGIVKAAEEGRF